MIKRSLLLFFLFLAAAVSTQALAATGDTSPCLVKDNKKAIWTFTSDDGFYETVLFYAAVFKKYNLKGTVGLVADWLEGGSGYIDDWGNIGQRHGSWAAWGALLEEGYIDYSNHTFSHKRLLEIDDDDIITLEMEINGGRQAIERGLSDYDYRCVTFIIPFFEKTALAKDKTKEQHIASRGGWNSPVEYNSLTDPDFYDLGSKVVLTATTLGEMNSWVDYAITNGKWLIETWHAVDSIGWEPPSGTTCENHMQYVSQQSTSIWVASFSEAACYVKERKNAEIDLISATTAQIVIELTDTLDNGIFNYPLTLKTQVDGTWGMVKVLQNGMAQIEEPDNESGTYYVYYDAVPDAGYLKLTPLVAGEAIVVKSTSSPSEITANGTVTCLLSAIIADKDYNKVNTAVNSVTFSSLNSLSAELLGINPASASNGTATITLRSKTVSGTNTVIMQSGGLVSGTIDIVIAPDSPVKVTSTGNPTSITANGTSMMLITAEIKDISENTVYSSTATVSFSVTGEGTVTGTSVKNALSGVATCLLKSTTTPGTCVVTATSSGLSQSTLNVRTTGTMNSVSLITTNAPASMQADGTSTSLTVAVLKDVNGNIVCDDNNSVTFCIKMGPGQLLTDTGDYIRKPVNGITTMLLRSTAVPGDIFVNAACGGVSGAALFFRTSGEETLELSSVANFPNPFSGGTTFTYDIRTDADSVIIKVFSLNGRLIWKENSDEKTIGYHNYYWDGKDLNDSELSNGIYFYKITVKLGSEEISKTGKLVKMK
jgi:hypothetical protein